MLYSDYCVPRMQLNTLLAKQESGSPLWLSLACEDLRVFGQAELIPQKINSMAADLFGLIRQVLFIDFEIRTAMQFKQYLDVHMVKSCFV